MWFSTYKSGHVALAFLDMSLDDLDPQVQLGWHCCLISQDSQFNLGVFELPIFIGCSVKSLLLNPIKNFSGVNSAEGCLEIKVVLPFVPAHNCLLKALVLKSNN